MVSNVVCCCLLTTEQSRTYVHQYTINMWNLHTNVSAKLLNNVDVRDWYVDC